ncbi:PAB-dependent poly(A)-specific ribonuclease subunit PAN3-like isoform X2 [Limulus polyphemus]|uniref:PAN2-PAN3 deadenylation complex subunit PAN3 n=1 Tax=Limulus polyphemus TaxID=6850 RepID=A0ABM1S0S4_LIMPO|nr:PAB-dependent poly(A)-specific ribonuclease subunit PAN3-like isoform X2 [Limulus polyphemus]
MLPTINGPAGATRKTTICRYFATSGTCFYGNDCQFLHANPNVEPNDLSLSSLVLSQPSSMAMSMRDLSVNRLPEGPPNPVTSLDPLFQVFAPTTGLPPESKLQTYMNTTPRTLSPSLEKSKSFVPSSSNLHFDDVTSAMAALAVETSRKTPNPSAAEFVPMSSVLRPSQGRLTHSMSTPSFFQYALSTAGLTASTPFGRFDMSQGHSPCLSPDQSPLVSRKSRSPLTTTFVGGPALTSTTTTTQDQFPSSGTVYQQESVGGTTYFFAAEETGTSPKETPAPVVMPDFTLYSGNPAHIEHMKPKANAPSFFLPDELRMDILHRRTLTLTEGNPQHYKELPSEVDNYHNLCPLEPTKGAPTKSATFRFVTSVYKATNIKTGVHYCLRRIHGFRLTNAKCMTVVEAWKKIQHSNLVHLREVFTTKAFSDHSIVFVYDYYPGADNLMNQYFSQPGLTIGINGYHSTMFNNVDGMARSYAQNKGGLRQHAGLLPESQIWAYVVQLSSALRTIHAAGLACRAFEPTKILITGKSRLRLNCCGIFDVLSYDASQVNPKDLIHHFQQEDLLAFGKVVLALACNSLVAVQRENLQASMELVSRNYSADLRNLLMYLLSSQTRARSINEIMPMIGARFYTQLDAAQMRSDVIENELAKDVENGRLLRLLIKLGTINERPEYHMDPSWAETGDCYLLKLFRDYLFHQVTEDGRPWIDMAHVVQCLNKLDLGSLEKICLTSCDEQNVLVVSYAELKQCFESSFNELLVATTAQKPHAPT